MYLGCLCRPWHSQLQPEEQRPGNEAQLAGVQVALTGTVTRLAEGLVCVQEPLAFLQSA